jgi:predicted N-acetyltransferase YhbS
MEIGYLADRPQFIPTLARWFFDESPDYFKGKTWRDAAAFLEPRLNRDRIPLALVAFEGDKVMGTVSLAEESLPTHSHLTPWLAGLHVVEEFRHQGIATALVEALVKEAKRLRVETLYIGISRAEDFYFERGWQLVERIDFRGRTVTIMKLDVRQTSVCR